MSTATTVSVYVETEQPLRCSSSSSESRKQHNKQRHHHYHPPFRVDDDEKKNSIPGYGLLVVMTVMFVIASLLVDCCGASSITINSASSNGYKPSYASTPRAAIPVEYNEDCGFYIWAKVGSPGDYFRLSLDTAAKTFLSNRFSTPCTHLY